MFDLKDAFNRTSPTYDRLTGLSWGYHTDLKASAAQLLAITGPSGEPPTVLDLCCGTGASTRAVLAHMPEGSTVTGLDFSAGMLAIAQVCVRPPYNRIVHWYPGDAMRPPQMDINGRPFDAVFMAYGLRNFPPVRRAGALRQIHGAIRPGGRLVIHEYSLPPTWWVRVLWTLLCWGIIIPLGFVANRGDAGLYTYLWRSVLSFQAPDEVVQLLKDAGFTAVRTQPTPTMGMFTRTFVGERP